MPKNPRKQSKHFEEKILNPNIKFIQNPKNEKKKKKKIRHNPLEKIKNKKILLEEDSERRVQ